MRVWKLVLMIQTINLTKRFGTKVAVNHLNLDIKKGEIFGFLGPNAAGKTTTIKLLAGLLRPTEGNAYLGGFDMQKDDLAAKRILSYIPDAPFLYERLTGREFLRFISEIYNLDGKKAEEKREELLSLWNLSGDADTLIEEYSHGMRQKLVYCAALLHDPKIILVDEPMVGLDPKSIKLAKDIFKAQAGSGTTIFMSTHTLSIAEEICDRVGIIDTGNLIAVGTIDELKKQSGVCGALEDVFLRLT